MWPILSPILCLAIAYYLFKAYRAMYLDWRYQENKRYGADDV